MKQFGEKIPGYLGNGSILRHKGQREPAHESTVLGYPAKKELLEEPSGPNGRFESTGSSEEVFEQDALAELQAHIGGHLLPGLEHHRKGWHFVGAHLLARTAQEAALNVIPVPLRLGKLAQVYRFDESHLSPG